MANPDLPAFAFQKPAKGDYLLERKAERRKVEAFEEAEKAKVRKRDQKCRWPGCDCAKKELRLEVAHLHDKAMGGDHGLRSTADQMILLCFVKHQGRPSLHSGDLEIRPKTELGTNGPCDFYSRTEAGRMEIAFTESVIGVSVAVGQ